MNHYYGAGRLQAGFDTVRKNTLALAEEIPDDQYGFRASPETRSVGEMLAHLAVGSQWQIETHSTHVEFIPFDYFMTRVAAATEAEQALAARGKAAIVAALVENGRLMSEFLGGLSDATLAEVVSFPPPVNPPSKTRFEMILGIKEHEMHHRGQLMLIQRMLGMVPHLTRARQAFRAPAAEAAR